MAWECISHQEAVIDIILRTFERSSATRQNGWTAKFRRGALAPACRPLPVPSMQLSTITDDFRGVKLSFQDSSSLDRFTSLLHRIVGLMFTIQMSLSVSDKSVSSNLSGIKACSFAGTNQYEKPNIHHPSRHRFDLASHGNLCVSRRCHLLPHSESQC